MLKRILPLSVIAGMVLFFVSAAWADVPAPPVNQNIGFIDTSFATSGLERADCLAAGCHMEAGIEDRHHLLYNQFLDAFTIVPYPDLVTNAGDPPGDERYNCQGCHSATNPPIVVTECGTCHLVDGASSPHHRTALADAGNCKACHGDLVDNMDDGHYIPLYDPSLVTPSPSRGDAFQTSGRKLCSGAQTPCLTDIDCTEVGDTCEDVGAGACNYCHDDDGLIEPVILTNRGTHHGIDLVNFGTRCTWCHQSNSPPQDDFDIRTCEGCHGPDSLHNIQTDSPNINNVGTIVIGGEDAGWGHVGRDQGPNDSDCWGCHGFAGITGAPGSGPAIPSLGGADVSTMKAGTATTVTLSGAAFTNTAGTVEYLSDVALTAADGSTVTVAPDSISEGTLAVTIPAGTAPGNYDLQAVKAGSASNPAVVSVTPAAVVTDFTCDGSTATINGSGFVGYQEGSGTSVTGTIVTGKGKRKVTTTETGAVSSWNDTQIVADFSACPNGVAVTSVFGDDPPASCSDYGDAESCNADSNCEWSVNKKGRGSCSDAGSGGGGGGGKPPKNK